MPLLGEMLSLGAALFWAVGVILFKKSGDTMSPMALNLFKNAFAVLLFVPTLILSTFLSDEPLFPDRPLRAWVLLAVSGIIGIGIADTLFFMALRKLGAGLTAVVDTSYLPVMLFLSWLVLGDEIGVGILMGGGLIMAAMLLGSATKPLPGTTQKDILVGIVLGTSGIVLMGIGVVMVKGVLMESPLVWANTVRLFFGCVALIPMILLSGRRREILAQMLPSPVWKQAIPGAFFGTYLAIFSWLGGMKYTDVSVAALLNQLSTVFIFIFAVFFLAEPLTWRRSTAVVLAFFGACMVVVS